MSHSVTIWRNVNVASFFAPDNGTYLWSWILIYDVQDNALHWNAWSEVPMIWSFIRLLTFMSLRLFLTKQQTQRRWENPAKMQKQYGKIQEEEQQTSMVYFRSYWPTKWKVLLLGANHGSNAVLNQRLLLRNILR